MLNVIRDVPSSLPVGGDHAGDKEQRLVSREQRDLLCVVAYVALGAGDGAQAVTLLDLVVREMPDDADVLRLLAYAQIAVCDGDSALATLDRLAGCGDEEASTPALLLRGQALRLAGRLDEGRAAFRRFVEVRNSGEQAR